MRAKIRAVRRWLVTPKEIKRSDAVFDVPPAMYPLWIIGDIVFGATPRAVKHVLAWYARRQTRQQQPALFVSENTE